MFIPATNVTTFRLKKKRKEKTREQKGRGGRRGTRDGRNESGNKKKNLARTYAIEITGGCRKRRKDISARVYIYIYFYICFSLRNPLYSLFATVQNGGAGPTVLQEGGNNIPVT